jgi:tRNA threonylcarbamoyl adenosine modification protein (Sua5/YciO/YrdC/YwlC family)
MTSMSTRYPTGTDEEREAAISAAARALRGGEVAVIPTDTVYGVAADAFDPAAVRKLLAAKGRGREMPPPVLVSAAATVDALASDIPDWARALFVEFWPGPLTVVLHQQSSLQWDLGETRGTVAVRVPDHPLALEILGRTGPLAVSSANRTGRPAALDADTAEEMLGSDVDVIVDGGTAPGGEASTILDATAAEPRLLRLGALSVEKIDAVLAPHGVSVQGAVRED